jgi:hypothetical protein
MVVVERIVSTTHSGCLVENFPGVVDDVPGDAAKRVVEGPLLPRVVALEALRQ